MKTISLIEPFKLELSDRNAPQASDLAANDALVKVHRVGICGTDLHAFQGHQNFFSYPRILGHELAVEVVALGKNAAQIGIDIGDYAAVNPYLVTGTCSACDRGKPNCCVNLQVLGVHIDGGMREQFVVSAANLYKADLSLEELAQVEMLAIGAHAVQRARLTEEDTVLVVGAGPIGLGTTAFAAQTAAQVLVLDVSEVRLEFVTKLGLAKTIHGQDDVISILTRELAGDLPTVVFDATGNAAAMRASANYVAHGGQLVFVGHTKGDISLYNPTIHSKELSIHCSRNATPDDFATVINALTTKAVDVRPWITHRASPEALVTQFESWTKPETGVIKGLLTFS
ncbi:MAG: zinc-binding alcohol dehydrogenase family protein [Deinococcota bacterium]